jgi:hypothetical protein
MMSRIDSRHWKISNDHHFQNGHHNTVKIQHCPISSKFVMWVDNDVPNWFPTLKNFYRSPFSKWPPQYRTNSTLFDFNEISLEEQVCVFNILKISAIFKMATKARKKSGDVWETFRNSILLLSYLVYLLIRSILFTTINKVEIENCNIMKKKK